MYYSYLIYEYVRDYDPEKNNIIYNNNNNKISDDKELIIEELDGVGHDSE